MKRHSEQRNVQKNEKIATKPQQQQSANYIYTIDQMSNKAPKIKLMSDNYIARCVQAHTPFIKFQSNNKSCGKNITHNT